MERIGEEVKDLMEILSRAEDKYLYMSELPNLFELAVYLYVRYGEIPIELETDENLKKVAKKINRYETLTNEELNEDIEDLILGNEEESEEDDE